MPEFISKLQHKNHEKGEFSDEKTRTLEETVELIKNFPWDQERGVDIQLTGPSVTIKDENGNYLKIALFFNGKFCLYYLDNDNHLYEYHTPDLDDADNVVSDFFNGQIELQKFEKHLFSVGNKSHFETAKFEYRISSMLCLLYLLLMTSLSIAMIGGTFAFFLVKGFPFLMLFFCLFFDAFILQGFYFFIKTFIKSKNICLTVSSGADNFQFENDGESINYNKKDISAINIFGQAGRSSRVVDLMEIIFKDGTSITISGLIMDQYTFIQKFPGIEIDFSNNYFKRIKQTWIFTK